MFAGETPPVLIAGDTEADLGRLALSLGLATEVARGIAVACSTLRNGTFQAVVADVATTHDALALLRAAGRARPPARVICLLPAGIELSREVERLIEEEAFALRYHPITPEEVGRLLDSALRHSPVREGDGQTAIDASEARLREALYAVVGALVGSRRDARLDAAIADAVRSASRVAGDSPAGRQILDAISASLMHQAHEARVA